MHADMNNKEIVSTGRDKMDATDAELAVARRVAAQTEETAVKTAAQLKNQTDQMQNVATDLNEIEFTMQRASRVIRDITRGLATDKCVLWPFCVLPDKMID
jgi:novel plant SNARE